MSNVGVFMLFLAGILGYAALLWRVMQQRAPMRDVAPRAAMEHVAAAQLARSRR